MSQGGRRLVLEQDDFLQDADPNAPPQQQRAPQQQQGQPQQQGAVVSPRTRDELQRMAEEHRRSLVGIGDAAAARGFTADDLEQLSSVTLSKRHNFTQQEYEAGQRPQVYQQLNQFQFDEATAAAQQQHQQQQAPPPPPPP